MLPQDASGDGHRIDATLHHALASVVVIFGLVLVALAVLLLRSRARSGSTPVPLSPGQAQGYTVAAVVIALAVFVGIDLRLAMRARGDLQRQLWNIPHGPDVMRVEVLARQWSWQCRNPGPDGIFGTPDDIVALDDLRVPVGRAVSVQLRAVDVVHSLFLPQMRVRQDAIPGRVTRTWFRPVRMGSYDMVCGQFCGQGHYRMRGTLRVLSADDYARWLRDASAEALRAHVDGSAVDRTAWVWRD